MLDRDRSFNYKGWVTPLYNEPAGFLFHDCEDGQLNMAVAQINTFNVIQGKNAFTAICLHCHARMPVEYSQVLMAMWNLMRKTC